MDTTALTISIVVMAGIIITTGMMARGDASMPRSLAMVNWIADSTDQMSKDVVCFLEMILLPLELVCIKTSSHSCSVHVHVLSTQWLGEGIHEFQGSIVVRVPLEHSKSQSVKVFGIRVSITKLMQTSNYWNGSLVIRNYVTAQINI